MCDVWSFGVAAWEVLSGGREKPYREVTTFTQANCDPLDFILSTYVAWFGLQVVGGVCMGKLRLDLSSFVSGTLRTLLESCFDLTPEKRPQMAEIAAKLEEFLPHDQPAAVSFIAPATSTPSP